MRDWLHDLCRQPRVALHNLRHSRLLLGEHRPAVVKARLEELFRVTNAFLRELGVDYWMAYGTLLGHYREGGVIAGDGDIDFALPEACYPAVKAAAHRLPPGFRLHDTSRNHPGPKLYVDWGGWEADLYFYRQEGDHWRSCERGTYPGERAPVRCELLFPLQLATFLGEPTLVPARPRELLENHYGYLGADAVRDRATGYFVRVRP